jgi:KDO2-lipid IV(A) lauroyltransferase
MARPRHKILDYMAYVGLRLFAAGLNMFDIRTNYRTARWLGELLWRIDRKHRRIACAHVRLSFPDWSDAQVERVARKSMAGMAYLVIEVLFTPRLITPRTWKRHVRFTNMTEGIRLVLRQQSGAILLTGHFGNFEIVGYTLATLGFSTVAVARPLDNPYIWDYMTHILERTGQRFLYKKGAMASATDVLDAKDSLSIVGDQDAGRKGLFVDFFGRPASTYKSIALLAIRYNVPIVVGYGKRLSDRFEFEIGVQRIIYPAEWQDKEDQPLWVTQEFTRALEDMVRLAPEQYLWVHRRWKHRPDGTKAPGDGTA